jgi:hypothetical protein
MFVSTHGITARPTSSAYGTLTTAWIAATGETDLTILGALNTLESDLTTYGLTAKMKALYPFVGGTAGKHSYNFMNTAAHQITWAGGITHSSTGVLFNGTNGFGDSNFNVNTYKDNNHLSYYIRTNLDEVRVDAGINTSSGARFDAISRLSNGGNFGNHITNVNLLFSSTDSRGLWLNTRTTSTLQKVYKNGTSQGSETSSGTIAINGNIYLGARNLVGTGALFYSTKETAFASIGDGLTDTEAANFYTAVQTFQTTLGRQVGTPIPFAMPLDTYSGAAAAYSAARRLATAYTGALIRVRRSSDNAEQDIGYTAGNVLDEAALTSFVGSGNNGFVTTWYDQSGNSKHATQSTATYQGRIFAASATGPGGVLSAGVIKTKGLPTVYFETDDGFELNFSTGTYSAASAFTVFRSLNEFSITTRTSGAANHLPFSDGATYDGFFMTSRLSLGGSFTPISANTYLFNQMNNGTNLIDYYNTTATNSVSGTFTKPSAYRIAQNISWGAYGTNCLISENILWLSDKTSDRTGINTNINTFYSLP